MLHSKHFETTSTRRGSPAFVTAAATLLFIAAGLYFASLQNIWVDETTQLSGSTLSPGRLIAWLAGRWDPAFGVPPDRMPPISYLIDAACAQTLCSAPIHFRWLHLAFAAGGVALIVALAGARYGWKSAAVTGAFLALSPKLTELGVEIRAYPIFFAISCVQIALVCRLADQPRLRTPDVAAFVLLSIAAIYTHFFGLVSSMALVAGLLAGRLPDRRDALLLVGAALLVLACAGGLWPFITAANSFSGAEAPDAGVGGYARYVLRLFGHPATMIESAAAALFFIGLALLLLITAMRIAARIRDEGSAALRHPLAVLAIALVAGVTVTVAVSLLVSTFNALKPQYNLWTFPILAVLVGAALARRDRLPRAWLPEGVAIAAAVVFAAGAAWSQGVFLANARWFVHGPGDALAAAVARAPEQSAIVYRGEFGWGYFPTYYRYRDAVPQLLMDPNGRVHRLLLDGKVEAQPVDLGQALRGRKIILADIQQETFATMRRLHRGVPASAIPIDAGPAPALSGWRETGVQTVPEFYWTRLTFFEPVED